MTGSNSNMSGSPITRVERGETEFGTHFRFRAEVEQRHIIVEMDHYRNLNWAKRERIGLLMGDTIYAESADYWRTVIRLLEKALAEAEKLEQESK